MVAAGGRLSTLTQPLTDKADKAYITRRQLRNERIPPSAPIKRRPEVGRLFDRNP
jgi:hypothetical protein